MSSIKDFILKEERNSEIMDELKIIEVEEQEADRSKMVSKGCKKNVFLVMLLNLMPLICIWQTMNRVNWQN